jgi:ankyrin repeat protein
VYSAQVADIHWSLLHKACWAGDAGEVERLLKAGADPNRLAPTDWRQRPLHRTLEFRITYPKTDGHVKVVRLLLHHGADPRLRATKLDMTPWELACFCGLQPAEELLRCYQPDAEPHPTGMSALWLAAAWRLPEVQALAEVQRPLRAGAEPNVFWKGTTPLMMAAAHAGHFRVADALLEAGADASLGVSLLHADWHFEHLSPALDYMVRHGWDVNNVDAAGMTALHRAAVCGYVRVARTLISFGADTTLRDRTGATAAEAARRFRKAAVAKLLAD